MRSRNREYWGRFAELKNIAVQSTYKLVLPLLHYMIQTNVVPSLKKFAGSTHRVSYWYSHQQFHNWYMND